MIDKELKVMDLAAFTLARDHDMPIRVFNMCNQVRYAKLYSVQKKAQRLVNFLKNKMARDNLAFYE